MTDPTREHITNTAAEAARERHTRIYLAIAAPSLMAVVLFVLFLVGRGEQQDLAGQVGALSTAANANAAGERALASQVQSLGGTPAVRVPSVTVGPSGPAGAQGPAPSQAQIDAAVNAYFGAHPLPAGQLPTATQVATAVAGYLAANPPVTPAQVVAAVVSYCSAANGCRGPTGADGTPGQNATDAQVADAVTAYCSQSSNPCQGPAGATGAQGIQGVPGDPGPACPDGYSQRDALITEPTTDPVNPLVTATQVPGVACVQTTGQTPAHR